MQNQVWINLMIILVVVLLMAFLLVEEYEHFSEHFRLIKSPRQDEVLFRQCERGSVPTGKDTCCPEDQYDLETKKCKSNECTTDRKRWLQMPICRQSHKGIIQSYGQSSSGQCEEFNGGAATPAASNAGDLTMGEYLSTDGLNNLSLCGGKGLPCTKLRLKEPVPELSMYKNMLITLKGSAASGQNSFAFYVHHDKPYLVTPIERFNEYDHTVLPLEDSTWSALQYNGRSLPTTAVSSGWDRIEDQTWYTRFNPLAQYNGKLLRREDQLTGNGAWAYVADGKAYALWGNDCSLQKVKPVTINATNTVSPLLPTGNTFHNFSLAYKQPWFNDLLPDCQINQQVVAHF